MNFNSAVIRSKRSSCYKLILSSILGAYYVPPNLTGKPYHCTPRPDYDHGTKRTTRVRQIQAKLPLSSNYQNVRAIRGASYRDSSSSSPPVSVCIADLQGSVFAPVTSRFGHMATFSKWRPAEGREF